MIVEVIPRIGAEPVVLDAHTVIVRDEAGVPIMVSGTYGPDGAIRASHALDDDFNDTLAKLGVNRTVICDKLVLPPPPPGAKLHKGPRPTWTQGD